MKILCPIDFSAASAHALDTALAIARQLSAEIVVAHAWYLPTSYGADFGYPADATDGMIEDAEALLAAEVTRIKASGFAAVSSLLVAGPPSEAVVTIVEADRAFDMIVVGTSGRTGFSRFVLGSVAEQIIRHSPCSVLAIHATAPIPTFRSILVPTDFSESSQVAADLALQIAVTGGRGVSFLHVIELPVVYSGKPSITEFARALNAREAKRLTEVTDAAGTRTSVTIVRETRVGSPAQEVIAAIDASEPPFDLVVIGSHGRTGLKRFMMGSVAEKVVRHASCPVLVARHRGTNVAAAL